MTSTHGSLTIDHERLRRLSDTVTGDVLTPGSDRFDDARLIFYRYLGRMPAVIVRPSSRSYSGRYATGTSSPSARAPRRIA